MPAKPFISFSAPAQALSIRAPAHNSWISRSAGEMKTPPRTLLLAAGSFTLSLAGHVDEQYPGQDGEKAGNKDTGESLRQERCAQEGRNHGIQVDIDGNLGGGQTGKGNRPEQIADSAAKYSGKEDEHESLHAHQGHCRGRAF